jgi:hypothetical protein
VFLFSLFKIMENPDYYSFPIQYIYIGISKS